MVNLHGIVHVGDLAVNSGAIFTRGVSRLTKRRWHHEAEDHFFARQWITFNLLVAIHEQPGVQVGSCDTRAYMSSQHGRKGDNLFWNVVAELRWHHVITIRQGKAYQADRDSFAFWLNSVRNFIVRKTRLRRPLVGAGTLPAPNGQTEVATYS